MSTNMRGISRSIPKDMPIVKIHLLPSGPYVLLAQSLRWEKLAEIANKHRSRAVDINNGRPLDLRLHLGAFIAQRMSDLLDRETEDMVRDHAAVRFLCGIEGTGDTIDHTSIAKFRNQLGSDGVEELNREIIQFATLKGFSGSEIVSSDTTVQEAPIAYPTEVGHLKNISEKLVLVAKKIKKGVAGIVAGLHRKAMETFTEIRLFTRGLEEKTLEKKKRLTKELHTVVEKMCDVVEHSVEGMTEKAKRRHEENLALFRKMIKQIQVWIDTGRHPSGKIISLWNQLARAITRNKAGKAVEFGRRWIISLLQNGYVIGGPCQKLGGDADVEIADEVLMQFLNCFGELPKRFVYDRGGDGPKNHTLLEDLGVEDCIFRKGQEKMDVNQETFKQVKRERALSEAAIAVLKGRKYGFNRPRARSEEASTLKGDSAILGANLTRLAKDLMVDTRIMAEIA